MIVVSRRFLSPAWFESFLAVVELGSFSQAAQRLHRSQSRISTHVAQLEAWVGSSLLDRQQRPVTPTEAGVIMAAHARRVLQVLDEASDAFSDRIGETRGTVILGTHPSISASFMPGLLARIKRQAPEVSVELSEQTTTQLAESLRGHTIDLAVRALLHEPSNQPIAHISLWRERFVAVFAAGQEPTTGPEGIQPAELARHGLIVIARPGAYIDPEFEAAFSRWGLEPRIVGHTEQPMTLLNLVRAGLGVGVLNELAIRAFPIQDVVVLPVVDAGDGRTVALCWDGTKHLTRAVRLVAHSILTHPVPDGMEPIVQPGPRVPTTGGIAKQMQAAASGAIARANGLSAN